MVIGGAYSFFKHGTDLAIMTGYIRGGAWIGLVLIIFGGLELAFGELWDSGPWQNRISRFAGALLVWLGLWFGLLHVGSWLG